MLGIFAAIILTSSLAVAIPALAFSAGGPGPIPGYLFPHPGRQPIPPVKTPNSSILPVG